MTPNHWLQATPEFTLLFTRVRSPGVPEPKRSAASHHLYEKPLCHALVRRSDVLWLWHHCRP